MSVSIDILTPQKSHIDLADRALPSDFGLDDYKLSKVFDDVILIEYCDVHGSEDGSEYILRGGNAWRKGKVVLIGPNVRYTALDEIVVFPNNMGIPITNLEVEGYGKLKNGLFINEQRMFGICKVNEKG